MQDLSHTQIPPGGWQFYQPQTKWSMPNPVSVTFGQAVQLIIKHRIKNPAVMIKHQLATDVPSVEAELDAYTRARLKIPPSASPKISPRGQLLSQVAGAAVGIKRAAQGTRVVLDWLTSGGPPVDQETANRRARICTAGGPPDQNGNPTPCPKNVKGSWYTVSPAEIIRETLSARSDLKLQTPDDDKLQSCDVCKCLMRLKCWVPLHFIKDSTPADVMAEFPSWCWINK